MQRETLSDRYLVERKLGSGGAAEVLLAADTILHRQVAIKRLHGWLSADREARTRFQQEAQAFARLTHPHIVALFDVGEDNNRPYLVMEYLEGETLRAIINHEGPFHPDDIAVVIEHIGEALDYAHRRGVVHRDIKPENVLVDRNGVVKVVDFGIAKVLEDATITQAGLAPGTAQYISPEQAQGHPVTSSSDIYSLGVIAYEMLAGRPPFTGDSAVAVATQHVNAPPPSPSDLNPKVPRAASDVVLRALAKQPADRYPSAGDFAQAMLRWKDQPTVTMPVATADPMATVQIPTTERDPQRPDEQPEPAEPAEPRFEPAPQGLGRAGIAAAAVLALLAVSSILWLLLDRDEPGASSPTATTGVVAIGDDADADPQPTDTVAPPVVVPTAPALVGGSLADAEGLDDIELVAEERADSAEEGTILSQDPPEGTELTDGIVRVVVSSGPEPIDVTALNLVGRDPAEVFTELTDLGVNVQRQDVGNGEIEQGLIVSVSPAEVIAGDTVTVEVSMGNNVQIPFELQQTPLEEATGVLEGLELAVEEPLAVSEAQILAALGDVEENPFEDRDVVGIQEEELAFGQWVAPGTEVTLVYFDASLED